MVSRCDSSCNAIIKQENVQKMAAIISPMCRNEYMHIFLPQMMSLKLFETALKSLLYKTFAHNITGEKECHWSWYLSKQLKPTTIHLFILFGAGIESRAL